MTIQRTYTVSLPSGDVEITNEDISKFRESYELSDDVAGRVSELLWLDLYVYGTSYGVDPHVVLREIESIESGQPSQQTKPATEFKRNPLKGLWHKHFFSAHFIAHNIANGLAGGKLDKLVDEVLDPSKSPVITKEMINELSHRLVHETIENRASENKLTGEWIVFAKINSKNHYLCLNTHDAGDQHIFDRIQSHCLRDFPSLAPVLSAASS